MTVLHVEFEVGGISETFVTVIADHILLGGWSCLDVEDCLVALEVPQQTDIEVDLWLLSSMKLIDMYLVVQQRLTGPHGAIMTNAIL